MIAHQLILLFGLIFAGYVINKMKILDSVSNAKISKFLVNAAIPATIMHSAVSQKVESNSKIIYIIAIAALFYLIVPFLSHAVSKFLNQGATFDLILTYSNLGFMGIPIVSSIYGEDYVFYVTIFMMIFNVSIFSQGIYILSKDGNQNHQMLNWKHLLNPGVISALFGMILFFLQIPIQSDLDNLLASIGTVTTPMAMIVIGSTLAEIPFKNVFSDISMYIFTFFKLLVYPALVYFVLRLCIQDSVIIGISVILSSLPAAGNVSMLCSEYGGDLEMAARGICISTLFSVFSVPLWIQILT